MAEDSPDRMRHIPPRKWFIKRIEHDARETIDLLYQTAFGTSHENRELEHSIEDDFKAVIRLLRDFAALAGSQTKPKEASGHLRVDLEEAVRDALRSLEEVDGDQFGTRASSDSFETSPWERLLATWLLIHTRLSAIQDDVEKLDAEVGHRLSDRLHPPAPQLDPHLLAQWKEA